MITDYTTWAESLCDAASARPLFQRPHALAGNDRGMTTDGHIALLLPAGAWDRPLDTYDDPYGTLRQSLDPPHWYASTLGAIRAWAGEPVQFRCPCDSRPVECATCLGSGSHDCRCGDEHECGRCAGTGHIPCEKCVAGLLPPLTRPAPLLAGGPTFDHNLDRNLVWKLLAGCPDPPETKVEVGWGGEHDPVVFRSADWTGLVMPTRECSPTTSRPLIPADWDNPLGGPHYDEDAFGRPVYDDCKP